MPLLDGNGSSWMFVFVALTMACSNESFFSVVETTSEG